MAAAAHSASRDPVSALFFFQGFRIMNPRQVVRHRAVEDRLPGELRLRRFVDPVEETIEVADPGTVLRDLAVMGVAEEDDVPDHGTVGQFDVPEVTTKKGTPPAVMSLRSDVLAAGGGADRVGDVAGAFDRFHVPGGER